MLCFRGKSALTNNFMSDISNVNMYLQMARAGFYYTGGSRDDDSVTCFVCGKVLDGWVRLQIKQGIF
jgi:hypothetical protein